jgi:uncharacterized repeat protein (TIGR04076 family)
MAGGRSERRVGDVTGDGQVAAAADPAAQVSLYDLRVVVERIEGRSVCGMRIGDWFELTESSHLRTCPGRYFCVYALAAVLPLLAAKQRELRPGDWLESDSLVACPDPDERLIMRIERTGRTVVALGDVT